MEYYIITRNGEFVPYKYSDNQCKIQGHPAYNYSLKMVFPKTTKLDTHGFIIDHAFIDKTIQKLKLEGSCEEMHNQICTAIRGLFTKDHIDLNGARCTIVPDRNAGDAFMDYVYLSDLLTGTQAIIVSSLLN